MEPPAPVAAGPTPAEATHAAALAEAERHVRGLREFIEAHRFLLDRHIVDFYIADPPPLRCAAEYTALCTQCWASRAVPLCLCIFCCRVCCSELIISCASLFPPQWAEALSCVRRLVPFPRVAETASRWTR